MGLMVKCPSCNHAMWASDQSVGRKHVCKRCEHVFIVPAPSEEEFDHEPTLETAGVEDSGLIELDDMLLDLGEGAETGSLPASDSSLINDLFSEDTGEGTETGSDFFETAGEGSGFIEEDSPPKVEEESEPSIVDPNEDSGFLKGSRDKNLVFVDNEVREPDADELASDGTADFNAGDLKYRPAEEHPTKTQPIPPVDEAAPVFRLTVPSDMPDQTDMGKIGTHRSVEEMMIPVIPDMGTSNPYERIQREDIHLHVKRIKGGSVLVEFPSQLLEVPAFRASIPMRCLKSGEADPDKLTARPFAWVDRLQNSTSTVREFSDLYARNVPAGLNERQFVDSLYPIEDLPMPFNLQMPYYLSGAHDKSVEVPSRVVNTTYGVGCEVLVPLSPVVLGWVGRVNGVCGEEYAELEKAVMVQNNRAWLNLPDKVRQRLSGWFGWRSDERFLIYLPDSDFSRNDEGLAGIVLTSKRLVYCKFLKHGQHELTDPATLQMRWDDNFCQVDLVTSSGRSELIRLRRENVQALQLLLEGVSTQIDIEEVS